MPVPEAAVNEDGRTSAREDQIGSPGKLPPSEDVAKTQRMQAMAQGDFRLGGTAPNRTHDARPGLLVHDIRHEISRR